MENERKIRGAVPHTLMFFVAFLVAARLSLLCFFLFFGSATIIALMW